MKYKVEVIADLSGKWSGNALRFDTIEQAERYAENLSMRWTSVMFWRIVNASTEEVVKSNQ